MSDIETTSAQAAVTMQATAIWGCATCGKGYAVPDPMPEGAVASCPVCKGTLQPAPAKRTKVAIVGFADSWPETPFSRDGWDIWCLNQFFVLAAGRVNFVDIAKEKRLTWFEMHPRHDLECSPIVAARHPNYIPDLVKIGCPIWMQKAEADIPGSMEYPLARMSEKFGEYWTNSISYMLALAIDQGYKEIGLYGVNMATDSEYIGQRPSCEYMIGWARGAGIKVHLPLQSDLLKAPWIYGYEDHKADATLAKIDQLIVEHQAKLQAHAKARDENEAVFQQFNGAIQQLQSVKKMWSIGK